jgi:hypothetical protein
LSGTGYAPGRFDPWKPAVPPASMPAWAKKDTYSSAKAVAQYTDSEDSHAGPAQLMTVKSRDDAFAAITTIGDQGEGYSVINVGSDEYDDRPGNAELSHYMKFLTLQALFKDYIGTIEELRKQPPPPKPQTPTVTDAELLAAGMVINFPDNPTTASYPVGFRPIADFCSACFQYMLIMSETVYRVPPTEQRLFFNEGLHRSMIWVLDKYIRTIREIPLGNGQFMAPVFENVDLGTPQVSFQKLTEYGARAIAAAKTVNDGKLLYSVMQNVIYYVCVATPQPNSPYKGRTLPDVGRYWTA